MTAQAEENAGILVEETLGDCAYGSGATRQEFVDASRTLIAKVPQENQNHGLFPKSAFVIHREERPYGRVAIRLPWRATTIVVGVRFTSMSFARGVC